MALALTALAVVALSALGGVAYHLRSKAVEAEMRQAFAETAQGGYSR